MRAVCIGECMVELAPAGDGLLRQGFAGDTFNTAWYLRRQRPDWAVDYVSRVGTDAISADMLGFMQAAGIGTGHITRMPDRTVGLYLISLKEGERSFSYWRGQSAAKTVADDEPALTTALQGAGLVVFSGITLAILTPDRREALLRLVKASGAVLAFDPNMRPRLWSGAEEMREWEVRAAQVADILLPSFDEEQALHGDASPEDTLARYTALGVPLVVVKNGGGRIHATGGQFDPAPVQPVDTTAAGDSFNAGFLAAHLDGAPLQQALAAGSTLAARVISARGALVP